MRKMKKSVKIIIIVACILAVAAASIVTALLIGKSKKDKGGNNPPAPPAYALTDAQIDLGKEISSVTSKSVSANKLYPLEYSSKLESKLSVSGISYLNDSVVYAGVGVGGKSFFIDEQGNPVDLLTKINGMNFVDEGYTSSSITFAGKNHFSVLYVYSSTEYVRIICTVENHEIILNKSYELVKSDGYTRLNGGIFKIALDKDFFVITTESGGKYSYEFFEYLEDYTNYESFKLDVDDIYQPISCTNGLLFVGLGDDAEAVAGRTENGLFGTVEGSEFSALLLKNGSIVETKTEHTEKTEGAELVSGKYVEYSYKLDLGEDEKELSLSGLTKISTVVYSSEKYFGVFAQGVDSDNKLNATGTIIYFDYDLNVIAKYSAKSASSGRILYSNDEVLLTSEGFVSGKTSADCMKVYDFESNDFKFVNVLTSGDFVLENQYENLYIYNLNNDVVLDMGFDSISTFIDDDTLIFVKGTSYYRYNTKTKATPVEIKYVDTDITARTSMYFVQNEGVATKSLYSGTTLVDGNVSHYNTGDNYLTYSSGGQSKTLYFVDKASATGLDEVSFTASAIYGGSSGSIEEIYGAEPTPVDDSIFDQKTEWYEYEDKVLSVVSNDPRTTTYKFTHCIQNGFYSKTNYVDYLEIKYEGQGNQASYLPFRIYYRVNIVDGNPVIKIISRGHHLLGYKELTEGMSFDSNCLVIDGTSYSINTHFALGTSGMPNTNIAYAASYDTREDVAGQEMFYYKYTDNTATADGSGLFLHTGTNYNQNRRCSAEVYGTSIKVTIYFDFTRVDENSELIISSGAYKFGQNMPITGDEVTVDDYYEKLYYQSVVVGISNENINYYTDFIDSPETDSNQIISDYFVDAYLKNETYNAESFNRQLAFSAGSPSTMYNACISKKTYITSDDVSDFTKLCLGGEIFKTNIVGAQIVGITTLNEVNHQNITIKSLYDSSESSGSRNYFDDRVEMRILPLGATSANGEDNEDNVIPSKYLSYDPSTKTYFISIKNKDYIYCAGGLNTFRYVYCVFEPQTFYVNVDYNVSGNDNSFGNEIDYLQTYLALNIGLDYRNDYVQYNKAWVYRNAREADPNPDLVFGTYDNANKDKYYPYDFTDVSTRQEIVDLTTKSPAEIEEIRKKNENQAKVYYYIKENEKYSYVVIDGVRYYFQNNFYDESEDYSKSFSKIIDESPEGEIFVKAYKNINDLNAKSNIALYGKIAGVNGASDYYTAGQYYNEKEDYNDKTKNGVYSAKTEEIYLRIPATTAADNTFVAYYHEVNLHQRDDSKVIYDGYYSFDANGEVIVPASPDPTKQYDIQETFSFMYTDNIVLTRLPQHTHYDLTGFKVILKLNDGTDYEYVISLDGVDIGTGLNVNVNSAMEHPFLAEYEGGTLGKRFYNIWRSIDAEGKITWNNTIDNPVRVIAQWKPKQCNVEAVLYIKKGTQYIGVNYETSANGSYTLSDENGTFNIASNATAKPVFKIGTTNIDTKDKDGNVIPYGDGILDFSESTEFEYKLDITFGDIGALMATNDFKDTMINTTGLSCQFVGWAFKNKDDNYVSMKSGEDPVADETYINEFIGDTTTITIYAYYTISRYNFFLRFNSMGGATLNGLLDKSYYSKYDFETATPGNDNIYNGKLNPAVYDIDISEVTGDANKYEKHYSTIEKPGRNTLLINNTTYGVDVKDETNPFYVGNSVQIKITLNEQYYAKTIVMSNIVFRDDSGLLDLFDVTFTYEYTDDGGSWTGKAISKTHTNEITVTNADNRFYFGNGTGDANVNKDNNAISITQDEGSETKIWTINITGLSFPGLMSSGDDYSNQRLEGIDGFTMIVYPESYTIETEKVEVYAKDENDEDVSGPFSFNQAILTSSQPLTNIEGKEIEMYQPCYIWLGTSKYMFTNSWNTNFLSGYYLLNSDGSTVAVYYESFTYAEFSRQRIKANENLFVYFDSIEKRVYYPAQYSGVGNTVEYQTSAMLTASGKRYYFKIDRAVYYINFDSSYVTLPDALSPSAASPSKTFLSRYCLAYLSQTNYSLGNNDDTNYNNPDYFYVKDRNTIAVYFNYADKSIKYRAEAQAEFSIGYNNTRVLTIDPDQERLYLSTSPSTSTRSTYYELNYYLSSMTVGGTTISFNKITRNILTDPDVANGSMKYYGMLNSTTSVDVGTSFVRRNDIYNNNFGIIEERTQDEDKLYVISYFGEVYVIQDAYKLEITPESGKVGATDYYFYLARSETGFTRYFLIYDESTTNMSDLKQNYQIKLTFKRLNRNLTIVAAEEDLYDAKNRSFEISYAESVRKYNEDEVGYEPLKYGYNYDVKFEDIIDDPDEDIEENVFYQYEATNSDPLSSLDDETLRGITSLKWKSTYEFTPATNRRLRISSKSGYIIKYIKVYIGSAATTDTNGNPVAENYKNIMTFKFIDASIDDLFYYDTSGNYSYSSVESDTLVSYISYKIENNDGTGAGDNIAYGYKLLDNEIFGLYYSNFYDTTWSFGKENTYNFDHLFLMLSGLYEDVKIELATTSYTEYLFEDGETDTPFNPLIDREKFNPTTEEVVYDEISLSETYLNIYTMKYDENDNTKLVLDKSLNDATDAFTLRYYFKDSVNHIKQNTLRLIFFGTGSKVKHGIHFLATHEDYSVYFTNGRYYNEELSSTEESAFKNLEAFSGRTSTNLGINSTEQRNRTNKLVYMFTGALHVEDADGNYSGFYKNSSYVVRNESNFKFFMAVTAFVNEIGVRTSSYLYNNTLTTLNQATNNSLTYTSSTILDENSLEDDQEYVGEKIQYAYPLVNGDYEIVLKQEDDSIYHYQLDTLHKTQSWFNDTAISNIQLLSYLDSEPNAKPKTWSNRNEEGESELTRVEMGGLKFNWRYYEMPGYYLRYLMIKIADINSYFVVDLIDVITDSSTSGNAPKLIKTIRIYNPSPTSFAKSYDYKFNLYYVKESEKGYGYFRLHPVFLDETNGDKIDEFSSVSLMSNDIQVCFMSMAYDYRLDFKNYSYGAEISTKDTLQRREGAPSPTNHFEDVSITSDSSKFIYYDSMIPLDITLKMDGYTFIGWASFKYYSAGSFTQRYDGGNGSSKVSTWNTSSVWFDPTVYFPDQGAYDAETKKNGDENIDLLMSLIRLYDGGSFRPSGAFYTAGGYFVTDTGIKSEGLYTQNYNFYADYIDIFSLHMKESLDRPYMNQNAAAAGRKFELYAIWKVNTYAIEFDVNNSKGDAFYVDYRDNTFAYEFTSDKIGFRKIAKTQAEIEAQTTLLAYVIFDTNQWYTSIGTGGILMYSKRALPYTLDNLCDSDIVSKLAVDMFGYTWLGWYYVQKADIREGETSVSNTYRVFDSFYSDRTGSSISSLPKFDQSFINQMGLNNTIFEFELDNYVDDPNKPNQQKFVYKGMHKAVTGLNAIDGYVCFYDYSDDESVGNANVPYASLMNGYVQTIDFLNEFRTSTKTVNGTPTLVIDYDGDYISPIILSYYDTFMSKNCYSVSSNGARYSLKLTTQAEDVRRIKLFANWSQNKYTTIVDKLDANEYTTSIYHLGSTNADNVYGGGNSFHFNDTSMARTLLDRRQPTKIGYDFVGWSFSYIPPLEGSAYQSIIASVNAPSQYLYLCKETLAEYTSLNGAAGTSDLESNILMLSGSRISDSVGPGWILNQTGTAEKLGDRTTSGQLEGTRYVYLFPIWKVQTFSINISLNIEAQDLLNLHERDSSFAVALFESADNSCKTVTGVNSNYYTFNKNAKGIKENSLYYYYYNEILANVNFEIEFDQPFSTATCNFAGKTYKLKDLMMTSAGYYFLGLMANSDYAAGTEQYVVKNLLRTTLKLNDGYVHHDDHGEELESGSYYDNPDYLAYENITDEEDEEPDMFDFESYKILKNTKFSGEGFRLDNGENPRYDDPYNFNNLQSLNYQTDSDYGSTSKYSSNFGTIGFSANKYNPTSYQYRTFSIMSERDGGEYYLYIIHNNIRYYVVYYVSTGSSPTAFEDAITFDRTYLYYNVKDAGGVVTNRYIIRFDAQGNPYYVDNTFSKRHILTLDIALYTVKTNKLNTVISSSGVQILPYSATNSPNGSLTGGNNGVASRSILSIGYGSYTLKNKATREFTLFANWEVRNIKSTVINGNNDTGYNEDEKRSYDMNSDTANSNGGLAGYYIIDDLTAGKGDAESSDFNDTQNRIELEYEFYSNVNHRLWPFFGGRFLSELTIELDTLMEDGTGDVATYRMRHNTIVLNFEWDNEKHIITISSVTVNGVLATGAVSPTTFTNYALNKLTGIDLLSFLDKYSLNNSSFNSGVKLYNLGSNLGYSSRPQVNRVDVDLNNVITSLTFTCKYSVQTFSVEVYNVVGDDNVKETGGVTSFGSISQMHLASNYYTENRGIYATPYISSVNYTNGEIPVISTDCAKIQTISYNVPFYYFLTDSSVASAGDSYTTNYNNGRGSYGLYYLYEYGLYENGVTGDDVDKPDNELYNLRNRQNLGNTYEFRGWYYKPNETGSVVYLTAYPQSLPVTENRVIYGYYQKKSSSTRVLFYYWDQKEGKYVQYANNEKDYDSSQSGLYINGNHITRLPSPSIAPWYGAEGDENKKFLGYIYIDGEVHRDFVSTNRDDLNEAYNNAEYKASSTFTETKADVYSSFYMNRHNGLNSHNSINTYINTYIKPLSIPDMFSNRLVVYDHKYFFDTATVGGRDNVKILDGVRLEVTIPGGFKIYKDFKMLNVGTELKEGVTHAIPIYEEIELKIKDVFAYKDTATLTSNTNMIESTVFETNSQYTVFYDPRDLRIVVGGSHTLETIGKVPYLTFKDIPKTENGKYFDYRKVSFDSGQTVYVYYVKADETPFYMSNGYGVQTGQVKVETKVEMYDSPLEIELSDDYLEIYRIAYENIEEMSISTEEKVNRRRVIYIMLQLLQGRSVLEERTTPNANPIYYSSSGGSAKWPNDANSYNYDIDQCVRTFNYYHLNISDSDFVANVIYYDPFSMFRLAYSLAYDFTVVDQKINTGTGLSALFGTANTGSKFRDYAANIVTETMKEKTFESNEIKPGDIMLSYRHNDRNLKTIMNVLDASDDRIVYAVEDYMYKTSDTNYNIASDIYDSNDDCCARYDMYIAKKDNTIYFMDLSSSTGIRTTEVYDNTTFQKNDTYQKFYHGKENEKGKTPANEKETSGYYTLNAELPVDEDDGGFFNFNGSKTYYYYGGYYYNHSSFESAWKGFQTYAIEKNKQLKSDYDTKCTNWNTDKTNLETKWKNYRKYLSDKAKYESDLAAYNKLSDEEKKNATRPTEPTKVSKPSITEDDWKAANPYPEEPDYLPETDSGCKDYVTSDIEDQKYDKKYNLTRYTTFSSGRQHWFGYASSGEKLYDYYYYYTVDQEYYYLSSNADSSLKPESNSSYGTGWDRYNSTLKNNYWLILKNGDSAAKIYSRWKSFF